MALKAKGRISGRTVRMIPSSFGNADDPRPVAVTYRVPTEREKRELTVHGEAVKVRKVGDVFTVETSAGDELDKQHNAIRRMVTGVENYTAADDSPIDDGAKLAEHGDSAIVFEVANAVMASSELDGAVAKKSIGSPSSGSVATPLSDGTAKSASEKDSMSPGIATDNGPGSM